MTGFPGLFAVTNCFEEWEKGWDAESGGDYGKGSGGGVTHVLVVVVDVGTHGGDHCR